MEEDEGDPNLGMIRASSTDMNTMSDDFLSMLNTDCKPADIDEFNTWFQDNISPDPSNNVSDSILDNLLDESTPEDHAVHQKNGNVSTQFYPPFNELSMPSNTLNYDEEIMEDSVPPYCNVESASDNVPYYSMYENVKDEDVLVKDSMLHNIQSQDALPEERSPVQSNDYYVKETYFKDQSGNNFVEHQYIRRKNGHVYSDGNAQEPITYNPAGIKRSRTQQAANSYTSLAKTQFVPHRTIIRPVRGYQKIDPDGPKQVKPSSRSNNVMRGDMKPGLNIRGTAPQTFVQRNATPLQRKEQVPPGDYKSSRVLYISQDQENGYSTPPYVAKPKKETMSPTSGVISAWEESIKQKSPATQSNITFTHSKLSGAPGVTKASSIVIKKKSRPVLQKGQPQQTVGRVEVAKIPIVQQLQPKVEETTKSKCKEVEKEINHISIVGKPGLVKSVGSRSPASIKIIKPVNTTKPILKQPQIKANIVKEEVSPPGDEVEPEEKRTNHNAVERKYRYSINDKILELKQMLVPKDTKIQKSGVLRKAIEHINHLQGMISKLKYDNTQLKKKQDILEQNNHVLTLKLAEQGASVVYLEKTPDLIEPSGPYDNPVEYSQPSPEKSPDYYGGSIGSSIYQHLPDSPESLRQSDGETRHVRSNSASSGGYSSSEDMTSHVTKRPRYMQDIPANQHRDQRTFPMLCMVFIFGLFVPSLMPKQSIAASHFGRSLLAVTTSHDYLSPAMDLMMYLIGFIVVTTLSYLFFVVKNKVHIKNEGLFKKFLQNAKTAIENNEDYEAQATLEQVVCGLGLRVTHSKLSYSLLIVEYLLSILPHNKIVQWLCCSNSSILSDMLLLLAHLQYSPKLKRYDVWAGVCYALQAARYNLHSPSIYLTLSILVDSNLAKAHFYRRSKRRDDRWIENAKHFIAGSRITDVPIGKEISSYLEVAFARYNINEATKLLVLSDEATAIRKQGADRLLNNISLSLLNLKRKYPDEIKELAWIVKALQVYQASEEEIKRLPYNESSECSAALSAAYYAAQQVDEVNSDDISDTIDLFQQLADQQIPNKLVLCVGLEWLFQAQIEQWNSSAVESVTQLQKCNFKRTIHLLSAVGKEDAQYKVSLYTTVHRVMCRANPSLTKSHLQKVLHPTFNSVNNYEQVLAIDVCLKYVPTLLMPQKDSLVEHMKIFLRSQC